MDAADEKTRRAPVADDVVTLEGELAWAAEVIEASLRLYFGRPCAYPTIDAITPPNLRGASSSYARAVLEAGLSFEERFVLILALIPHLRPQLLDPFFVKNENFGRAFTEFGGVTHGAHGGFLPTVETAAFVLAGTDLGRRMALCAMLGPTGTLRRRRLVVVDEVPGAPGLFGASLGVSHDRLASWGGTGEFEPSFRAGFPARRITTSLAWDDLVLPQAALDDVEEIRAWAQHRRTLMQDWKLGRILRSGFRSLFHGPPGTGKTLTATLLGKVTGLDVYRIDLALVVSKYVGETEKNLAAVFEQAEINDWILFFDEADALFGKRTATSSSHDRYANQEVAYLLQQLEEFSGIAILATNLRGNIDQAFSRRFQSVVYFPLPSRDERLRLWRNAFTSSSRLKPSVDLEQLADQFELSGGGIANVLRHASLLAVRRGDDSIGRDDILSGIRREARKEGTVV